MIPGPAFDILCFSHLRWDFVFQRPQHLLSRAARRHRVVFWEEPIPLEDEGGPRLDRRITVEGVLVIQPRLPWNIHWEEAQETLLDSLVAELGLDRPLLWYYTPHALTFSAQLPARLVVYDCMDELSAFKDADPALPQEEAALLRQAGLVFTGGRSLFEAKRDRHAHVHLFPSGVDLDHFAQARAGLPDPADQAGIPHPRAGFYGVLDERLDQDLLAGLAALRPSMHFILIGPTAKIDPAALPRAPNLHYLGSKTYAELPAYAANWDIALMPFALNAATRFISPTKTPEYLAAGKPVVSTPIADVMRQYGVASGVQIAADPVEFAAALDRAPTLPDWRAKADTLLASMSWDDSWSRMEALIEARLPAPFIARAAAEYDHLVVGAGFAGAVMAERLAEDAGRRVLLIDRRRHIGGNAHDAPDAAGILIHPYGPHIFHTNAQAVLDYLSRFTEWRPYEHRVLAELRGMRLPVPINRTTICRFFGVDLAPEEVAAFLAGKAERRDPIRTAADVVLSAVGPELYEALFQGYTRKQWGLDPSQLDRAVTARVPTRTNDDDRYFTDRFQCMPLHGYTAMFRRMLDHPNITIATSTDFNEIDPASYRHVVFTGPVDEFFGCRYGKLPYRSLRFRHETLDQEWHLPVAVVNNPAPDVPWTRVTEFKHLTGQTHKQTSLCYEYPAAEGDPYYPIPRPETAALYDRYRALADHTPNVTFVGRLATYRYYNMDQVVGQALATYQRVLAPAALSPEAAD